MSVHNFNNKGDNSLEYDQFQTKIIKENKQLHDELEFLKHKVNIQKEEIDYLTKKLNESEELNNELKELIYRRNGIVKVKKIKLPFVISKLFNFKSNFSSRYILHW